MFERPELCKRQKSTGFREWREGGDGWPFWRKKEGRREPNRTPYFPAVVFGTEQFFFFFAILIFREKGRKTTKGKRGTREREGWQQETGRERSWNELEATDRQKVRTRPDDARTDRPRDLAALRYSLLVRMRVLLLTTRLLANQRLNTVGLRDGKRGGEEEFCVFF